MFKVIILLNLNFCPPKLPTVPLAFSFISCPGARCRSVVGAFAHGAMGRRIDPSWGEPIELFLVPASAP